MRKKFKKLQNWFSYVFILYPMEKVPFKNIERCVTLNK